MTTQENYRDEWLERAFQLAFFLHGERETAKIIVTRAMDKLETASNAQFKRYYYTPTGRAESAKATRSRVSLNDLQLFQRLVFVESEAFERARENGEKITEESLLKFFVKHLVRISLKRNSFYVTLGVARILHNYATADAMEIYNIVVQDPERVHDDYYYRSRKGVLMKELKTRFGELLKIVRVNRGEERFQTNPHSEKLCAAAKNALNFFTPWSSQCALPEKFDPFADVIKPFHFDKKDPDEEHRVEVNRIHAALHSGCFARLAAALQLPAPAEKLEIPKFMLTDNQANFDDGDWRNPPRLDADELRQIKDVLTAQAESRKALTAGFLRVVVDGAERSRIDLSETGATTFDLGDDAELIEVRVVEKTGETLLATHLLSFDDLAKGVQIQSVKLEGGQRISFNLTPTLDAYDEVVGLQCGVEYAETAWLKRALLALRRGRFAFSNRFGQSSRILKPVLSFGLILLALTFGWLILQTPPDDQKLISGVATPVDVNSENDAVENPPDERKKETAANMRVADNRPPEISPSSNLPSPKKFEQKEPAANRQSKLEKKSTFSAEKKIDKRAPMPETQAENSVNRPRQSDDREITTDENGVLRLPFRENRQSFPREKLVTRGDKKLRGKTFAEIERIYIEITGDEILGAKIKEKISAELRRSNLLSAAENKDEADGRLIINIRHESDGDAPEDATVTAIVWLVNAEGFGVYPNRGRVSRWKYVGTTAKLSSRIARDLLEAAGPAKQKK